MAGIEVVDLTLTDDEEDVAVGNRDEEVVEVVVNREVRGAGPANRADDDEDEVVVTGAILGTPFPFLRRDGRHLTRTFASKALRFDTKASSDHFDRVNRAQRATISSPTRP